MSHLPNWRINEHPSGQPEGVAVRRPIVRPSDFVSKHTSDHSEEIASPPPLPPVAADTPPFVEQHSPADRQVREIPRAKQAVAYAPLPAGPILDLRTAVQSMWAWRLVLLVLGAIFAVLGGFLISLSPAKFTAETSIYFDPRQAGSSDTQAPVAPELVTTMIDSQTEIFSSGKVLGRVVDALKLDQDPKFNGGATGDMARYVAIAGLQKAAVISREPSTYVVTLKVTTADPEKSALIANQIVASFTEEESKAASSLYDSTNTVLDGRLSDLQQQLLAAEKAVESYRADNDMVTVQGNLASDTRLTALNQALVVAQQKTIDAKARADTAKNLRFEDVVSTTRPDAAGSSSNSLTNLRAQYATLAASVGSLESQLGARHPRLLAARSSLDSLSGEIKSELQRLATSAQSDYAQAQKAEQDVAKELAVQKALQVNTSGKVAGLNELERKATAARDVYQALIKRSGQTNEDHNLLQNAVRVISEATPPLKADGQSRKVMIVAGIIAGALLGFGLGAVLAILARLFRHPLVRSYFAKPA